MKVDTFSLDGKKNGQIELPNIFQTDVKKDVIHKAYINHICSIYKAYKVYIKQISYLLNVLGININTVPVLDVRKSKSNNIIGDRSYSSTPKIVSIIGNFCIDQFNIR